VQLKSFKSMRGGPSSSKAQPDEIPTLPANRQRPELASHSRQASTNGSAKGKLKKKKGTVKGGNEAWPMSREVSDAEESDALLNEGNGDPETPDYRKRLPWEIDDNPSAKPAWEIEVRGGVLASGTGAERVDRLVVSAGNCHNLQLE
jgi:hypothetical protein